MNIFLLLSGIFVATLIIGKAIEKIRIPWVFAALFIGLIISPHNSFIHIVYPESFSFLADLGMYFLLFIIGLEIDLKELARQGKFIGKLSFSLVISEALIGGIAIHYLFQISWGISFLVASSFATVGEAILVPILDEFHIIKTKFGQSVLGIGTLDDIIEIIIIIITSLILGTSAGYMHFDIIQNLFFLALLFFTPFLLYFFHQHIRPFIFKKTSPLFLFGLIILFLFIGIGSFTEASALGAILAGISLKSILNENQSKEFESALQTIAYGLFIPIFFIHVGSEVNLQYLLSTPLLIIIFLLITNSTKISVSYLLGRKELGNKKSILLGIALSAKFSTSIVIITLLYQNNIIPIELYSVLIGTMILSKFIIPLAFSLLLQKWQLKFKPLKN